MNIICRLIATLSFACCMAVHAADWSPDADDPRQVAAAQEIERMLAKRPALQQYFDEAVGFAIFPNVGRVAAGFGVIYGRGLVVEGDRVVGTVSQLQVALGFDFGAQWHSQIIFFRDQAILNDFKGFGFEFQGRGSAVLANLGLSVDPAYRPPVAIFSRTRAGLMVELAAHGATYWYRPVSAADAPTTD